MQRLINYLKDSRAEFVHISWPTRRQTIAYTSIVVVIALVVAVYVGILDYGFSKIIKDFLVNK
jgi:preprotein translocase subunit SecE